jgi:hypothetical protein
MWRSVALVRTEESGDGILHSHRRENLTSYNEYVDFIALV